MSEIPAGARHTALAVTSRRRLLEMLQSAGEPLDAAQLAEAVGLHVTTARFHLKVLEQAGLVSRTGERAGRPGRPRQLYSAVAAREASEGHRLLAGVLAGILAANPGFGPPAAEMAGRRWAEDQMPAGTGLSADEGVRRVGELFDRLGFAPRLLEDGPVRHLELDACPFRDTARAFPQVVCSVHRGLLRGALSRLGLPTVAETAQLRTFVEPELCIADVALPSPRKAG